MTLFLEIMVGVFLGFISVRLWIIGDEIRRLREVLTPTTPPVPPPERETDAERKFRDAQRELQRAAESVRRGEPAWKT